MANAYVHIDGFNLYYGALRSSPYRWLDLSPLCARMLPGDTVVAIKYFTAMASARSHDPQKPTRQQAYLRALRTRPDIKIIFGHFLTHSVRIGPNGNQSSAESVGRQNRGERLGCEYSRPFVERWIPQAVRGCCIGQQ